MSPVFTDGDDQARFWKLRPFGMRSNSSEVTLCAMVVFLVSMSGDSAVTLTASVRPPTFSEESIVSVLPSSSTTSGYSPAWKP